MQQELGQQTEQQQQHAQEQTEFAAATTASFGDNAPTAHADAVGGPAATRCTSQQQPQEW